EDVEAELGELRQLLLDPLEAAPRAREELVPASEAPALPVDDELERHDRRLAAALLLRRRRRVERLLDGQRVHARERSAFEQLARQVLLPALELPLELPLPGGPAVDPGRDGVLPAAQLGRRERSVPAVVADRLHRGLAPAVRARWLVADDRTQDVVAVRERVGPDVEVVAHRQLDRIPAAVEHR